jgi:predicted  nucleic acid-binding Zn-ribbon protein
MSTTFHLFRLQEIDSQIDKAQRRLDEIRKILDDDAELRRVEAHVEEAKSLHDESQKILHKAEGAVKQQRLKIEQTEAMLYGGSVKNPKEVQDLQNKVESLKRYLSKLEDDQLEAMLAYDEEKEILQKAETELGALKAEFVQRNSRLAGEQSGLNEEKERLLKERAVALPALEEERLELYNKLRKSKRGIAIASVNDGGCSACGSTLTLATQQKARSATGIIYCPSCQRILYGK